MRRPVRPVDVRTCRDDGRPALRPQAHQVAASFPKPGESFLTFRWRSWQGPEVARSEIGPEANQRWLRTQGSAGARTRHQRRSGSPVVALP
jgi:hypothetical protein